MIIFMIDSTLTVLTKLSQAKAILEATREQDVPLTFETSPTARAIFRPIKDSTDFSVWEPDTSIGVDTMFQPSMQMDEADAVKELYRLRKHYNNKWRD